MSYRKFVTGYVNLIMACGASGSVVNMFKNIDDNYKYYKNDKEGKEEFSNEPVKTVFYAAVDAASSAAAGALTGTVIGVTVPVSFPILALIVLLNK